ncbi:MAG TPA: NB-ARC domain-containing protein, partial [Thermoanaerobaculia bacterium]
MLTGLAGRHPGIVHSSLPEATFDDLGSLLRRGGLGLLHFVGHGDVAVERSKDAKIVLQDRPFRASNLSGDLQTAIKKDRPLVLLNACRVARQGWSLSGLGGWAEAWVRTCGCGAFVGPQWVVKDSLALEFARVFYQELDADKTFGEAVTAARKAVRKKDPGRPTWLAYVAYGHPGARLAFGSGAGIKVDDRARVEAESAGEAEPQPIVRARPVWTNAPAAPDIFLGRGRDVEQLKERLGIGRDAAQAPPIQVLTAVRGWPGVGKTSLAAFLANDPDIQTTYEGVLWASIGQEPDILGEMAAWGRWLGNDDLRQAANLKEAQTALRSLLRERRMVLVLDDVWEPAHAAVFQGVGGPGCPVLVTTRETAIAQTLAGRPEAVHLLDVLDTESALELLRALAGSVVDQHPAECRRLVEDLEKLPLALQVAGRLLRSESALGWGVDDLLCELGAGTAVLKATAPPDRADLEGLSLPTVSALFRRSTDRLDPELRDRYRLLGGFAAKPATFGLDLLNLVWETEDPRPSVRELVGRGLLEPAGD